jgi:hypothetical protein
VREFAGDVIRENGLLARDDEDTGGTPVLLLPRKNAEEYPGVWRPETGDWRPETGGREEKGEV